MTANAGVPPNATSPPKVLAIVLTYNAPDSLARCLDAIAAQTTPTDEVLVVDNHSTPPASLPGGSTNLRLLRTGQNGGPAGGHEAGLEAFLSSDADLAWVMDDDCIPHADCLEELLGGVEDDALRTFVFPTWFDVAEQRVRNFPAWCGFLVGRTVVETAGLPRGDFVWWAEDTEYLQWRIPRAGFPERRVEAAVVDHRRVRVAADKPAWKYYYEVRNTVFFRLYIQRKPYRRFKRLFRSLAKTFAQVALREDHRARKLWWSLRGLVDGLTGRLGRRVALEAFEQPVSEGGS